MNKLKLNMLGILLLVTNVLVFAQSIPEQEYLREQQAIATGSAVGCFLVLLFIAAVITLPIILCALILVLCLKK